MYFFEEESLRGIFETKVFKSGKLVETVKEHNLITGGAKFQLARLIAGDTSKRHITQIAFGTNGNVPALADTAITNQFTKPVSGFSYPEKGKVQFDWELLVSENNGMAISEFGLLTADGILFARRTRTSPINKAQDISIEGHWTIEF